MDGKIITSLKENKSAGKSGPLDTPRYVLSYKPGKPGIESAGTSYGILTALKSDADVVIEVNSSLFYHSDNTDDLIYGFIDKLKDLSLDYRYRRVAPSTSPGIFDRIIGKTRQEAHEVQVLIPNESWNRETVPDLLIPFGVRYYFTGSRMEKGGLLDEIQRMTWPDKQKFFSLVVFDMNIMGQMGINTINLSLNDLESLLKGI